MTNNQVLLLEKTLDLLLKHIIKKQISVFHLNWGLDKNALRIKKAAEAIRKHISKDLVALDEKAMKIAIEQNKKLPKDKQLSETEDNQNILFSIGLSLLSDEEKKQRELLISENEIAMNQENDLDLFILDPEKLKDKEGNDLVQIEYMYYLILKTFLPKDEDDESETVIVESVPEVIAEEVK